MISCLCVTRASRIAMLADAVADFHRQTFASRELVIVHDDDEACQDRILGLTGGKHDARVRVIAAPAGLCLGALRNRAAAHAAGDWICQWDDDDRYHPRRLELQWEHARSSGAAVCYLVDQLHWFVAERRLCWDDWDGEPYPLNFIQGTILARRGVAPAYPEVARGEDTLHAHAVLRADTTASFGVARLRGAGWCYVYRHHGENAWGAAHHHAISATKHLAAARLLPRLPMLRERITDYVPPLPKLEMTLGARTVSLGGER